MKTIMLRRRGLGLSSCRGIAGFSKTGITCLRNDKEIPEDTDTIIRWGTTSNIPKGASVLNTSKAVHEVNDKAAFRVKCSDAGLSPPSVINRDAVIGGLADGLQYPVVVRPVRHAQGRHIYKCDNFQALSEAVELCGMDGYTSNFVDKVAEYRVAVVSGRAVWVVKKTPSDPEALAWNVNQGGRFDNVRWGEWDLDVVHVAIKAFNLSQLDFGGVDVMVDGNGMAWVLEINSAPSLTSPYRQECFAKAFDWIETEGKGSIQTLSAPSWKSFIHPAISDAAEV